MRTVPSIECRHWLPSLFVVTCMTGPGSLGCGDDASATKSDAAVEQEKDATTPSGGDAKVGDFAVTLVAPTTASAGSGAVPGFTSITGKVYDGLVPANLVWEPKLQGSGCTLLTPKVPFCDPACVGKVCVDDDVCVGNPAALDVGTVTAKGFKTGAGDADFMLKAVAATYSVPATVDLPFPAFAEGDALELSAQGYGGDAFTLSAKGIAPLTVTSGDLTLENGKPLALTWKAPGKPGISRIEVKLDISHHGGSKGKIECDVEDSGSLEIPADQIKKLTSLGVAGFPTIVVTRTSKGTANITQGHVDLTVSSGVEQAVQIPGLVSCTDSAQCADGATCQADLTCK